MPRQPRGNPKTTTQGRSEGHGSTRRAPLTVEARRGGHASAARHGLSCPRARAWPEARGLRGAPHQPRGTSQRGGVVEPRRPTRAVGAPVSLRARSACRRLSRQGQCRRSWRVWPACPTIAARCPGPASLRVHPRRGHGPCAASAATRCAHRGAHEGPACRARSHLTRQPAAAYHAAGGEASATGSRRSPRRSRRGRARRGRGGRRAGPEAEHATRAASPKELPCEVRAFWRR
jgi:hypothetical protein